MTSGKKREDIRRMSVYLWSFVMVQLILQFFHFDYDDDDKFKKLEKNSFVENFLLYASIRTLSEIESQSLYGYQTKDPIPMIWDNSQFLSRPSAINTTNKLVNQVLIPFFKQSTYKKGDKKRGIQKGDLKYKTGTKNLFGVNLGERLNMPYQIQLFYNFNVKDANK